MFDVVNIGSHSPPMHWFPPIKSHRAAAASVLPVPLIYFNPWSSSQSAWPRKFWSLQDCDPLLSHPLAKKKQVLTWDNLLEKFENQHPPSMLLFVPTLFPFSPICGCGIVIRNLGGGCEVMRRGRSTMGNTGCRKALDEALCQHPYDELQDQWNGLDFFS